MALFHPCWKCNLPILDSNPWHVLACQAVMREVPNFYRTDFFYDHTSEKHRLSERGKLPSRNTPEDKQ